MSRYMMQIMVACLAVCCIILVVQNWQLQQQVNQLEERLNQQHNEQKQFQVAVSGELQAINKTEQRNYDILYEKIRKNKEDARENTLSILSLCTDLTNNAKATKEKLEIDLARLDEKVDANDKKVTEEIGENQQKVNNSMRGLAELFVNEMTTVKNETLVIHEKLKQLEAMAREPIMIENTVHVDTECHHHHHQVVPQLSLSEQIRQIVGGVLQSGTTYLWSKAMEIIGM